MAEKDEFKFAVFYTVTKRCMAWDRVAIVS